MAAKKSSSGKRSHPLILSGGVANPSSVYEFQCIPEDKMSHLLREIYVEHVEDFIRNSKSFESSTALGVKIMHDV